MHYYSDTKGKKFAGRDTAGSGMCFTFPEILRMWSPEVIIATIAKCPKNQNTSRLIPLNAMGVRRDVQRNELGEMDNTGKKRQIEILRSLSVGD